MTLKKTLFALAIAATSLSACQQNQHADLTLPPGADADTLSYQLALKYVKNYEKHAGTVDSTVTDANAVEKKRKLPNTRAIWFSIDRLEAVVKKIRAEGGDGVRFYLATYDTVYTEKFKGHKPAREYWGYNTLVMVSTKDTTKDGSKYHWDYYGTSLTGNTAVNSKGFIVGMPPENRGEQCPPPVTCKSIGATLVQ
ncbi:hypothetical protein [Mucilaginibacter sp. FT3.2]|uniref:hypothetical protein n=1 Tax=Mucilaginibacter sp. FT3.2 TaxID=2723090 RepID=UPI00160B1FFC|nr:hypothetical protein [Mucilaginibacter sp. FT3.2]MBB6230299.1 hypothetical protein [Mucilaginibacter sp. FT3.2]